MAVSPEHEWVKKSLSGLFEALTEELDISCYRLGNTTWRSEELAKGLEGDDCYYLRPLLPLHDPKIVDLKVDPPPDLFMEIEITRSLMDRIAICAAIRIPQIWCTDGQQLRFLILKGNEYEQVERSPTIPWVTAEELMVFVRRRGQVSDTQLMKEFRAWVRTTVLPRKTQTEAAHERP